MEIILTQLKDFSSKSVTFNNCVQAGIYSFRYDKEEDGPKRSILLTSFLKCFHSLCSEFKAHQDVVLAFVFRFISYYFQPSQELYIPAAQDYFLSLMFNHICSWHLDSGQDQFFFLYFWTFRFLPLVLFHHFFCIFSITFPLSYEHCQDFPILKCSVLSLFT